MVKPSKSTLTTLKAARVVPEVASLHPIVHEIQRLCEALHLVLPNQDLQGKIYNFYAHLVFFLHSKWASEDYRDYFIVTNYIYLY